MIAVLTGGEFSEREPSLASAATITAALTELGEQFSVIDLNDDNWQEKLFGLSAELVFIAMHGTFAEDGQLQEVLDSMSLRYTGSPASVAKIAFDKRKTKEIVKELHIAVPQEFTREEASEHYPVVVKPNSEGSSMGVFMAESDFDLIKLPKDELIEESISGREFSVGVIEQEGALIPLPVVEIEFPGLIFDYTAKYNPGAAKETCPANIDGALADELQSKSVIIAKELGIRHMARLDWIVRDGTPYFLEINTIPGMTPTSLLPKELDAAQIPFTQFIGGVLKLVREL